MHETPLEPDPETRDETVEAGQWLEAAEARIGYCFRTRILLEEALTHRSHSQGKGDTSYERLEFLGDALLELVVSEELLRRFRSATEGDLTRMRASLVSREHLYQLANRLQLGEFLRLGRGEERSGGRQKRALLADVFESVAGAIYLDGGLEPARSFILSRLREDLECLDDGDLGRRDHKSRLQEALHSQGKTPPVYRVIEEAGPPHKRIFTVEVAIEGRAAGLAVGSSKKKAEQRAAAGALQVLKPERDQGNLP